MREHILKITPEYFELVDSGLKTFEIRKNDRDYKSGDIVVLNEYLLDKNEYTGAKITRTIGFVCDFMQKDEYVVFSLLTT